MCMRERAKKSPFYVAYADRKPSHRKPSHAKEKLLKPSYAYMHTLRSQRNHSLKYYYKSLFPCASALLLSPPRQRLPPIPSHQHKRLLSTALGTGRIICSGGGSLEAARWRQQLGGGAVAAAAWGQQLGGGALAAAWWRLRQYGNGGSGGGGSSATARQQVRGRRQLGDGAGVAAAARRRWRWRQWRQLGGGTAAAAA
jgi:hypothetical protein